MARGEIDSGGDVVFSGFSIGGATSTAVPEFSPAVPGLVPALFPAGLRPDRDDDGMPDDWEGEHGLDPHKADGDQDPDGDGVDSRSEYVAGTHPRSGASRFKLPRPVRTSTAWQFIFRAEQGRIYRLWSSDSLQPGSWILEAMASGPGAEITMEASLRPGPRRFHVLEVRIP